MLRTIQPFASHPTFASRTAVVARKPQKPEALPYAETFVKLLARQVQDHPVLGNRADSVGVKWRIIEPASLNVPETVELTPIGTRKLLPTQVRQILLEMVPTIPGVKPDPHHSKPGAGVFLFKPEAAPKNAGEPELIIRVMKPITRRQPREEGPAEKAAEFAVRTAAGFIPTGDSKRHVYKDPFHPNHGRRVRHK